MAVTRVWHGMIITPPSCRYNRCLVSNLQPAVSDQPFTDNQQLATNHSN